MPPTVSFIVPCFKLAHFLKEAVDSILAQGFEDLEVLIMDDCSPDDTPAIARSFRDQRVRHVRNERNLGHLRNFNRGLELAAGEYIWLISADDALRTPYVLERFVDVLSKNPAVGYVFCPSVKASASNDIGVLNVHGPHDRIIPGRVFVRTLLTGNSVSSPAVLSRRRCYERAGGFPLDLPFAADWYLWCVFAMHADVGYLAEPMVTYRIHDANMTRAFLADPRAMTRDTIDVHWRVRRLAQAAGARRVASDALKTAAAAQAIGVSRSAASGEPHGLTVVDVEHALVNLRATDREKSVVLAAVHEELGDHYFRRGDREAARRQYRFARRKRPWVGRTLVKDVLLRLGPAGAYLRRGMARLPGVKIPTGSTVQHRGNPFGMPPSS